ncbi:hypothetical protein [Variovorax sp. YR216]|uniref:hypothetical protein n=1 Tax=Variovorax sp. YR216 TaxID=1882828 RepID=UPI00089C15F3|nr:hypothetical protein [Variovorax sp. YR216]SEA04314.1 hypothetical protein SAMN05444680_101307 [Variovorax sp. YR216]
MRVVGLIGLVLALLVVGLLAKKQMSSAVAPALPPGAQATTQAPAGDVRTQSRQIQEQVKQSLDAAQQRRPVPDDN